MSTLFEWFGSKSPPEPEATAGAGQPILESLGIERPEPGELRERVVAALRTVYDPEIPVNIYDLGLVYRVDLNATGDVYLEMTLTAPGCPVAQTFPGVVAEAVRRVEGVGEVQVELVWDPPWDPGQMGEAVRLQLGLL